MHFLFCNLLSLHLITWYHWACCFFEPQPPPFLPKSLEIDPWRTPTTMMVPPPGRWSPHPARILNRPTTFTLAKALVLSLFHPHSAVKRTTITGVVRFEQPFHRRTNSSSWPVNCQCQPPPILSLPPGNDATTSSFRGLHAHCRLKSPRALSASTVLETYGSILKIAFPKETTFGCLTSCRSCTPCVKVIDLFLNSLLRLKFYGMSWSICVLPPRVPALSLAHVL